MSVEESAQKSVRLVSDGSRVGAEKNGEERTRPPSVPMLPIGPDGIEPTAVSPSLTATPAVTSSGNKS